MSDNTVLNSGSGGDTVAMDDIGGVKYQIVKPAFGALDTANIVTSTATNPFPVALSDTDNAVLDQIEVNTSYGDNTGGGVEAGSLRVTIANDSTGVVSVDDGGGSLTVDNAGLTELAAAINANELDVNIASSNATVTIAGAVTNAGTFVVQEDGAALTSLQLIDDVVYVDDAAGFTLGTSKGVALMGFAGPQSVNSGDMAVLAATTTGALHVNLLSSTIDIPVTLDGEEVVLGTGSNAIGKLAANSGVDIGDVDVTSIAAGTNIIGSVFASASTSAVGSTTFYDADLDETKIEVADTATNVIYSIMAFNTTAVPLFLQLWDLDADNVTVGTTAPTNQYVIPGNADSDGAGFVSNFTVPKKYTTGFTVACTTDSEGSAAPGAGACIVNIEYATA